TDPAGAEPNASDPSGTTANHYTARTDERRGGEAGDGTVVQNGSTNNFQVDAPAHTYGEEGVYTISVTVTHETAPPQTVVTGEVITVNEVQITTPAAATGTPTINEGARRAAITAIATFSDPAGAEPNASDPSGTTANHYTA